jgi:hydroxypyruvate reductase
MPIPSDPLVDQARACYDAAVRRVQADRLLANLAASREGEAAWTPRPLVDYERVVVGGMGKAALAMAGALEQRLDERIADGRVVVPAGYPAHLPATQAAPDRIAVDTAGHPLPDASSVDAGEALLQLASRCGNDDLLVVLVSGGGTALTTAPAGTLSLGALQATYQRLLDGGVPIQAANAVRKHLTRVGGGQLARVAAPADVAALVVSDVVGDDLATIASGPTVPDPTTYADAVHILQQHTL